MTILKPRRHTGDRGFLPQIIGTGWQTLFSAPRAIFATDDPLVYGFGVTACLLARLDGGNLAFDADRASSILAKAGNKSFDVHATAM